MPCQGINLATGKVLKMFKIPTATQLERALRTAATCYTTWRHTSFTRRAAVAAKAAASLRQRVDEFARPMTLEMGKRIDDAHGDVVLSADIIDYYAKNVERFLAPQKLTPKSGRAVIESSPLGVILGVQPWNPPCYQFARFAAPNLMAGNVVMVIHASCVPQCALAFKRLWREAGAPMGAYTNLFIPHDQVKEVIDDPRIQSVALTGGVDAARGVATRAGQNVKKTTMELGGSDAFVVLEDADKAVKWADWAKMSNIGQRCIAGDASSRSKHLTSAFVRTSKRRSRHSRRSTRWTQRRHSRRSPRKLPWCNCWPRSNAPLPRARLWLWAANAFTPPAHSCSRRSSRTSNAPNSAFREEFLGPVALFFRVKDEEETVALANDSDFCLGGSVFAKDVARGQRVASRIDTGMVFINHPTWTAADLPFGGIKNSGYGRQLTSLGIQEFVNKKLLHVASIDAPA